MNKNNYVFLIVTLFAINSSAMAQDSTLASYIFDEGLSVRGGIGHIAVRDEFISDERYSGVIPFFGVSWSRFHNTYGYRLQLEYQSTPDLRNYNVSAEITQFRLGLDYLYPVGDLKFMSREVNICLGPTAEFFIHFRRQNIANGGSTLDVYSFASLFSGGIRSEAWMPIFAGLQLHGAAQMSIVSLGGRMVNPVNSSKSFVKLLTPFSGFNASAGVNISYGVTESLAADVGYRFDMTRISAWDFFVSGDDNFIASISYAF